MTGTKSVQIVVTTDHRRGVVDPLAFLIRCEYASRDFRSAESARLMERIELMLS